ncbi:MAG: hypothetical protein R3230_00835 [Nitrosopumilaceae archaeon]|nr:hypothetical protein [Nitrosopumilaceae archaeon]
MTISIKVAGTWRDAVPKVKVAGTWRDVTQAYVKVAGVWRELLSLFGWDLTDYRYAESKIDNVSFYVGGQDDIPRAFFIKPDGTKMFMAGNTNDTVYQYSLSTAWDISTASYDSVSFNFSGQDTLASAIRFKPDGTKMYILGSVSGDIVYQYSLSTAWDISTASYDSVSFNVGSEDTQPAHIQFKDDGTKMFMAGNNNDTVYQYSLSTAWDISTLSYDSVSFSISGQDALVRSIFIGNNGTKMFMVGNTNDTVYQYSLSTAWDISTASYDSVSYDISSQQQVDLFFRDDGIKMYSLSADDDNIRQHSLSTAWDISTASYNIVADLSSEGDNVLSIFFKPDGTKMYTVDSLVDADDIYQYSLSTPWDISTASYDSVSFNVGSQESVAHAIFFKDDGTKMYITGTISDDVHQYSLSTAWDVSTASYDSSFSLSTQDTIPTGLFFKSDGTKMYFVGAENDTVYQYSLSTAWDISTLSYDSVSFSYGFGDPSAVSFKDDGTKMYIVSNTDDTVYQYSLSTAWDISTASYDDVSVDFSSIGTAPNGLFFKSDGTKMYIADSNNIKVYQYDVPAAWNLKGNIVDLYTTNVKDVSAQEASPWHTAFKTDGTKMYVVGATNDTVYQYSLSTAWDISTASYDSVSFAVPQDDSGLPTFIAFKDDGTKMYMIGYGDDIHQYSLSTAWDLSTASYDNVEFALFSESSDIPFGAHITEDGTKLFYCGNNGIVYRFDFGTAWDVSTLSYIHNNNSLSYGALYDISLNDDGTLLFLLDRSFGGGSFDHIIQLELSTAWDLTTIVDNDVSYKLFESSTSPVGFEFFDSGKKFYITDNTSDSVYQYNLQGV